MKRDTPFLPANTRKFEDFGFMHLVYQPKSPANRAFVYIIDGQLDVLGQALSKGDGFGIRDDHEFPLSIIGKCEFLLSDVPYLLQPQAS